MKEKLASFFAVNIFSLNIPLIDYLLSILMEWVIKMTLLILSNEYFNINILFLVVMDAIYHQ